jgi:hypothetical protein
MHTDIHVLNGIRTHDPSVHAGEDFHALDRAVTVIGSVQNRELKSLQSSKFLRNALRLHWMVLLILFDLLTNVRLWVMQDVSNKLDRGQYGQKSVS